MHFNFFYQCCNVTLASEKLHYVAIVLHLLYMNICLTILAFVASVIKVVFVLYKALIFKMMLLIAQLVLYKALKNLC